MDFKKDFDFISTIKVIAMLKQIGVDDKYLWEVYQKLSLECEMELLEEEYKTEIKTNSGVKQGNAISPTLFIGILLGIMDLTDWEDIGNKVGRIRPQ